MMGECGGGDGFGGVMHGPLARDMTSVRRVESTSPHAIRFYPTGHSLFNIFGDGSDL